MQWQTTPYILLLFLAAMASFLWMLYGVNASKHSGWKPPLSAFVVLCFTVSFWATGYAIQLAIPTLEGKLLAYNLLHIGSVMVPPAWFAFALAYSGRPDWLTLPAIAGIVTIPLLLLVTLLTDLYSLAITGATVETYGSLIVLVTANGPMYLLFLAYAYVVIVAGFWLIVSHAIRSPAVVRRQAVLLITGAAIPLVLNVFNVLAISPFGSIGVNLTPVSLSLSTILFGIVLFRYRIFDLMPVARDVVLAQMSDGVIVIDDRERIIDLNPAAEALLGDRDALVGATASSFIPQYDRLKRDNQFCIMLMSEGEEHGERTIQLTRSPLTESKQMLGWVVLTQDVTALERQRRELKLRNERLDAFTRSVSHDLRNPLAVVDGYTTLAEETGEERHFLEIHDAVSDMTTFLEELLHLSQNGETISNLQPVPLATIAEQVRQGLASDDLDVQIATDAVVMADQKRLQQALDNLFRNARDHGEDVVTVSIGEVANGFFVEDNGPGIPTEVRKNVFQAGFTTRREGSGFGLAIVHDIVEAHGWSISVTEGTVGGARFEITGIDSVPLT